MRVDTRILVGVGVLLALVAGVLVATASPPMPGPSPPPPAPPAPPMPAPPPPQPAGALAGQTRVALTPSNYTSVFNVVRAPPGTAVYVLKPEYRDSVILLAPGTYEFPPGGSGRAYLVITGGRVVIEALAPGSATIAARNIVFVDVRAEAYGLRLAAGVLAVYAHPHRAASLLLERSSLSPYASGLELEAYSEDSAAANLTLSSTAVYSAAEVVAVAKTPPARACVEVGPYAGVEGGLKAFGYGPGYTCLTVVKAMVKGVVSASYLTGLRMLGSVSAGLETHAVFDVSVSGSFLNYSSPSVPARTPHVIA